jgi:hypothetical protein
MEDLACSDKMDAKTRAQSHPTAARGYLQPFLWCLHRTKSHFDTTADRQKSQITGIGSRLRPSVMVDFHAASL